MTPSPTSAFTLTHTRALPAFTFAFCPPQENYYGYPQCVQYGAESFSVQPSSPVVTFELSLDISGIGLNVGDRFHFAPAHTNCSHTGSDVTVTRTVTTPDPYVNSGDRTEVATAQQVVVVLTFAVGGDFILCYDQVCACGSPSPCPCAMRTPMCL